MQRWLSAGCDRETTFSHPDDTMLRTPCAAARFAKARPGTLNESVQPDRRFQSCCAPRADTDLAEVWLDAGSSVRAAKALLQFCPRSSKQQGHSVAIQPNLRELPGTTFGSYFNAG
jgi:hypothetical protein